MEGLFLLPNTKETNVGVTLNQSLVGGGVSSDFGNKDVVALHETTGESSTVPTAIISTLLESDIAQREIGGGVNGGDGVQGPTGTTEESVEANLPAYD